MSKSRYNHRKSESECSFVDNYTSTEGDKSFVTFVRMCNPDAGQPYSSMCFNKVKAKDKDIEITRVDKNGCFFGNPKTDATVSYSSAQHGVEKVDEKVIPYKGDALNQCKEIQSFFKSKGVNDKLMLQAMCAESSYDVEKMLNDNGDVIQPHTNKFK